MKTFVINLKKNTDRLAFIKEQLEKFGIEFERIDAVNGKAIKIQHNIREFLVDVRWLAPGEIGCAMSHLKIYKRMIAENLRSALVLEDDVRINSEICAAVKKIEAVISDVIPQVYLLNAHGVCVAHASGLERLMQGCCTDGYIVNRKAAELIIKFNDPVVCAADMWKRWVRRGGLELYRYWPTVVSQDKGRFCVSDVLQEHKQYSGIAFWLRRAIKSVTISVDWLWWKVTGK